MVLFDARGERLRPAPLEVKEGAVTSVAFGPEGQIAAGYGGRRRRRRRRGALRRPGRAAPTRAAGGQGGRCHERGLRAGGPDRRGIWRRRRRRAAAWCSSTPGASGSDPRRWRSRRAMSRAWPSGRRARSPRDMAAAAAAAAWCSSTPGASGSDPRRWRSRRALSRAWPSGRRARSPRDMAAAAARRRRGALRRPGRAAPTRAAGGQGGRCHERGLRAGGPDRRGISAIGGGGVVLFDARGERLRPAPLEVKEGDVKSVAFGPEGQLAAGYGGGGGGGVVLFDARGERLRPAPLEVKEGDVKSVAFGPEGRLAAGYGVRRRIRRRGGALRRPRRAAPARAAGGQGGRCHERGLRAGGPDRRGI